MPTGWGSCEGCKKAKVACEVKGKKLREVRKKDEDEDEDEPRVKRVKREPGAAVRRTKRDTASIVESNYDVVVALDTNSDGMIALGNHISDVVHALRNDIQRLIEVWVDSSGKKDEQEVEETLE